MCPWYSWAIGHENWFKLLEDIASTMIATFTFMEHEAQLFRALDRMESPAIVVARSVRFGRKNSSENSTNPKELDKL